MIIILNIGLNWTMTQELTPYNTWKLKRMIKEFREFLMFRCLSRDVVRDDRLYKEYIYLLKKYEEFYDDII